MKELGGPGYLVKLTADGAGLIGARDFAQQIYDLALLRELVSVGRGLVEGALDTSDAVDPKAQIEQAEAQLYKVAEGEGETGSMKSFLAASTEAIKNVEKALNSGGHLSGVTTGLDSINAKCGGLHNSDLIILAGRPGMGKTSLATNIAFNAAQRWLRDEEDGIPPEKASVPRPPFQPRNVGRPACNAYPCRTVGDQFRSTAHGQDQPRRFPRIVTRKPRPAIAAALYR